MIKTNQRIFLWQTCKIKLWRGNNHNVYDYYQLILSPKGFQLFWEKYDVQLQNLNFKKQNKIFNISSRI